MKRFLSPLLTFALLLAPVAARSDGISGSITPQGSGGIDFAPAATGGLDPATTAWVQQVGVNGGAVSGARQTIVDTFIKCVRSANLWTTLDRYWLLAGEDQPSARTDMVSPATAGHTLTLTGAPAFTANAGYVSSTSNFVDTNYVPSSSAVNYLPNSATFGGHVNSARTTGANVYEFGASDSGFTNVAGLNALNAGPASEVRVNSSASGGSANTSTRGSWIAARTGASAVALYYNGSTAAPGATLTTASTALPNASFIIGGLNLGGASNFSGDQISTFFVGGRVPSGGWSSADASAFHSCQLAMLQQISGVTP